MNSYIGYSGAFAKPTNIPTYDAGTLTDTATYQGVGKMACYGLWKAGIDKSKIAPGFGNAYHFTGTSGAGQQGLSGISQSGIFDIGMADPQGMYGAYLEQWDTIARVPYKGWIDGTTKHFLTYENERSFSEKINWLYSNGYGGVMIYDLLDNYIHTNPTYGGITNYSGVRDKLLKSIKQSVNAAITATPVKIMLDGDSYTNGGNDVGGYRPPLKVLLTSGGYNTDFVGSQTGNHNTSGFTDWEHEGYNGTTVYNHLYGGAGVSAIRTRLTTYNPDIITIQLGSNDLNANTYTTAQFGNYMSWYIDTIFVVKPTIKVILTTIAFPDSTTGYGTTLPNSRIRIANDSIRAIVMRKVNAGKYVLLYDANTTINNPVVNGDLDGGGIHPNLTGNAKWAATMYLKVAQAIMNVTIPIDTTPSVPTLVSPTNGIIDQSVTPTLKWNKVRNVSGVIYYDYYLDPDSTFSVLPFFEAGTTTDTSMIMGSVDNLVGSTKYYWRVSARNSKGTSSGYSGLRHFTTISTLPPGIPVLISPINNKTGVLLTASVVWGAVTGAIEYQIQVDTNNTLPDKTVLLNGITTSTNYSLLGIVSVGKTYYWRVKSHTLTGWSDWSTINSFTVLDIPSIPMVVYPTEGIIGLPLTFSYRWNKNFNTNYYNLQVSTENSFTSGASISYIIDTTITTTNVGLALTENTTYYWRISAVNSSGASAWTMFEPAIGTYYSFTTLNTLVVPDVPILKIPTNGATSQSITPTLVCYRNSNTTDYIWWLSDDSTFSNLQILLATTQDTFITISPNNVTSGTLLNSKTYWWKVAAGNTSGTSIFSNKYHFTTGSFEPPGIPILTNPINNAINILLTDSLKWSAVPNAISYNIQVRNAPFGNAGTWIVDNSTILNYFNMTSGNFQKNTKYFWRVNTTTITGTSAYSVVDSFTTLNIPTAPGLVYPTNILTGLPLSFTYKWHTVSTAIAYVWQISTSATFQNLGSRTLQDTALTVPLSNYSLSGNTTYYWRVCTINAVGASDWSSIYSFTTIPIITAPSIPVLLVPINGAINQEPITAIKWNKISNAEFFQVICSNNNFVDTLDNFTTNDTSSYLGILDYLTTYSWKVRAYNSMGYSNYSATRTFTIKPITDYINADRVRVQFQIWNPRLNRYIMSYGKIPFVFVDTLGIGTANTDKSWIFLKDGDNLVLKCLKDGKYETKQTWTP